MNELLTARELAQYLKLNPVTVLRKARKGEIPAIRVGKNFRFNKSEIDKWLTRETVGRPAHILVIDDEPLIGQFFRDGLKKNNCQVTTTASGFEAVEFVAREDFDLIFLDLVMPELDGSEVFQRIRQINERVPIAIITSYLDSDLMQKVIEQGPFLVMKKPLDVEDLRKIIHNFAGSTANKD